MRSVLPDRNNKDIPLVHREQDQLAYLIHDMRSVATSVSLMVDILELAAKAEDDSVQRARAVSAQKGCDQMALLCAEAALLITGDDDDSAAPEKFNLVEMLVDAATVYSPIYDLAGKTLRLETIPRSPKFFGNRSQMFRAISNLLDNGLKHTESGATVDIRSTDGPDEFAISVADDGPGIGDVTIGKSRQLDSLPVVVKHVANLSGALGPGTGLRFVAEVVAAHGGKAFVAANSSGGSTFTLSFPKLPTN